MRNAYILIRKPEEKRPLGRPMSRWVDNIKIDLKEITRKDVDWTHFTAVTVEWQAPVNTATNLWIQKKVWNFLTT
jgi:hypothetical protein